MRMRIIRSHLMRLRFPCNPVMHFNLGFQTGEGISTKGLILEKWPMHLLANGEKIVKAVIQDQATPEHMPINVFCFGTLAQEFSDSVEKKDLLFLTGFALVKSPTVKYDKRHICHLELFEEKGSTVFEKNVKYTYSKINQLKPGMLANVYGVVTFFKHPFLSKGTDYCSTLTITDQTGGKLSCNMFNEKQDALPQIYKTGDIVRFHRIKIQQFQGDLRGITNVGFSALTFDGRMGSPVSPRTSSKSYHFSDEDRRIVEQLRQWTMEQSPILEPALKLSEVQPQQFFDLICQLVAKAEMDRSSTLLKVWDGTKCLYPIHKVQVDGEVLEGNPALIFELQNISVDIMAYDNHTEVAKCLKPGAYVRIYNLHAKLQASTESDSQSSKCIEFYLHGGTSYGRGIKILPEDCYDVKELKKQEVPDEDDIAHVLQEASKKPLNSKLHNMSWYNTVLFDKKNQDVNKIALHFLDFEDVVQDPEKTLILTERIHLLHYVFMIKLTLKDGTASVDAMLWEEAEKFFKFSAAEVIASEVLQEQLELTMNMLCPKEKNPGRTPPRGLEEAQALLTSSWASRPQCPTASEDTWVRTAQPERAARPREGPTMPPGSNTAPWDIRFAPAAQTRPCGLRRPPAVPRSWDTIGLSAWSPRERPLQEGRSLTTPPSALAGLRACGKRKEGQKHCQDTQPECPAGLRTPQCSCPSDSP
ncbi:POTE1 protein, partial [Polypterus senegalus]